MYREILTKAIIAKGEKRIEEEHFIAIDNQISRTLGCWVINHKYEIKRNNQKLNIKGHYEVYIWYGFDDDTKCTLINNTYDFEDEILYTYTDEIIPLNDYSEIKSYSLKQPTCVDLSFKDNNIKFIIQRDYAVDIVGETKLTIKVDEVTIDKMIDTNYIKK